MSQLFGLHQTSGFYIDLLPAAADAASDDRAQMTGQISPVRTPLEAHMDFYVGTGTHAGYSATWFTLSAAMGVLTFLKFVR